MATYGAPQYVTNTYQPTVKKKKRKKAPPGAAVQIGQGLPDSVATSSLPEMAKGAPGPAPGPPPDPQLMAAKAAANLGISLGDAWDTYAGGRIATSYGNLDNPTADLASNPYSRAALLQKSYNNQKRGTTNSYASSGQLYAGSLQNAQEANLEGFNTNLSGLRQSKQDEIDELTKGKLTRYSQVGADVSTETLNSILRSLGVNV